MPSDLISSVLEPGALKDGVLKGGIFGEIEVIVSSFLLGGDSSFLIGGDGSSLIGGGV